jgi:hypothetical protein
MIKISQPRPKDSSSDRFKIEVTTIMELFMSEACKLPDMPLQPTGSLHGHQYHRYGPWSIYLPVDKATEFVEEVGFFTHEVSDGMGATQQIVL